MSYVPNFRKDNQVLLIILLGLFACGVFVYLANINNRLLQLESESCPSIDRVLHNVLNKVPYSEDPIYRSVGINDAPAYKKKLYSIGNVSDHNGEQLSYSGGSNYLPGSRVVQAWFLVFAGFCAICYYIWAFLRNNRAHSMNAFIYLLLFAAAFWMWMDK